MTGEPAAPRERQPMVSAPRRHTLIWDWIEPSPDGRFVASDEPGYGKLAALFPVFDREGWPLDVIAWLPERPGSWWTQFGEADVLGLQAIAEAEWTQSPVHLYAAPAGWHQSGCYGACVLNWKFDPLPVFGQCREIVCDSYPLRRRLADRFAAASRPRVTISVAARRCAA